MVQAIYCLALLMRSWRMRACRFKGTDTTFGSFPSRLGHILSDTLRNVKVECIVFPAYEVRKCLLLCKIGL